MKSTNFDLVLLKNLLVYHLFENTIFKPYKINKFYFYTL